MQKILITCEHGGREIPEKYGPYFQAHQPLLETHRGWDIGALELYKKLVAAGADASFFSETSRLLVELNRSLHHPNLFSDITRQTAEVEREAILEAHYHPYRKQVENAIQTFISQKHSVLHLSVHSFTPELNGEIRNADIGLLYDPQRNTEKEFCARWKQEFEKLDTGLKVRFNYPYRGTADGFTTHLRKLFPDEKYGGIELEVNQKFPQGDKKNWEKVQQIIMQSFYAAVK
ncbi:N-formylglutamate amidohydrolase [Adhaeribacter sp. BT258]|uniref:N-formylglutamate amidohydrolase n=1 Tax=Adhaeribacter terrigena TaxID=2793070 RepID=A0ABS1C0H4_9BACT|nr:N-formylglutamate amidohydrolase [Adhaeribacter terrigena]MBK0402896.1 N-formylglutamate amidohydrolase [Adhaeribacter terrigena]